MRKKDQALMEVEVDAQWYLETYPDVAHRENRGKIEENRDTPHIFVLPGLSFRAPKILRR
jgi:hypothetical protein